MLRNTRLVVIVRGLELQLGLAFPRFDVQARIRVVHRVRLLMSSESAQLLQLLG